MPATAGVRRWATLCYPLELFQRVVTVNLETQRVVKGLSRFEL